MLYTYTFNADKTGYEVVPSMADGNPVAVGGELADNGKPVSKVWEISVKDDLEWYFHPDTAQAFLDTNPDTAIDANDFIETFKLAVDESWFRAISGGGDFLASTSRIKNMQEYIDGTKTWDEVVGITDKLFDFLKDKEDNIQ